MKNNKNTPDGLSFRRLQIFVLLKNGKYHIRLVYNSFSLINILELLFGSSAGDKEHIFSRFASFTTSNNTDLLFPNKFPNSILEFGCLNFQIKYSNSSNSFTLTN